MPDSRKPHEHGEGLSESGHRPTRVTAMTFDLWNTLYSADSAYDKVRTRRAHAMRRLLASVEAHPSEGEMEEAHRSSLEAFEAAWMGGRHFGSQEHILHFLDHFSVDPSRLDQGAIPATALEIEDASLLADLELLPGVRETIPALAARGYRLGIISDTSLTTGRILRSFLKKDGLLDCFTTLTFSDETGYPKPNRRMFESTLAELGARPSQAIHVGDTPRTDIAGAKALGMMTIRCAARVDSKEPPKADFVIRDHREIPAILSQLG
jgi:FMN hydrolase / 5-amino-6-(5-phospho-D-ribitylamino)uracil phosphatase